MIDAASDASNVPLDIVSPADPAPLTLVAIDDQPPINLAPTGEAGIPVVPEAGAGDQAEVKPKKSKAKTTTRVKPAKKDDEDDDLDAPEREAVIYRSRSAEGNFKFMGHKGIRNPRHPGLLEWHIPLDQEERADRHHHVYTGRIVKVAE